MNGMSNSRFRYYGPATIDGVDYPEVTLSEPPERGISSWTGTTSFSSASTPEGFSANVGIDNAVTVELPDGRLGQAFISVRFDGSHWTLDLTGTGPVPA